MVGVSEGVGVNVDVCVVVEVGVAVGELVGVLDIVTVDVFATVGDGVDHVS